MFLKRILSSTIQHNFILYYLFVVQIKIFFYSNKMNA